MFDRFFDAVDDRFAGIPDCRKHDEFNSILRGFRMESNNRGTI
jgi:hypothetical protein